MAFGIDLDNMKNYYSILILEQDSTWAEIKTAYKAYITVGPGVKNGDAIISTAGKTRITGEIYVRFR